MTTPAAERPIGVDVSKYNVSSNVKVIWNPDTAKKRIDFVIQRASYGGFYGSQVTDESFEQMWQQVRKIPIRGAYHYYSSHSNWKIQADYFLNLVEKKDYHFFAIDYELAFNTLDKRTTAEFIAFVDYVKEQTKKKTLAYFNYSSFISYFKPFGYSNWVNTNDIWYAWYPYQESETPPSVVRLPEGMLNWKMNQYGAGDLQNTAGYMAGANYGGGMRGIDLNQYNGSIDDLYSWAVGKEPIVKEPTDEEKLKLLWEAHPELH